MTRSRLLDALIGDAVMAGWFTDAADLAAMLAFEAALAATQAERGLAPAAAATAIEAARARFAPDWGRLHDGMARDGVTGPAFVASLRETVDEPHRMWLHHRATSQDVTDTSLALRLKPATAELDARLAAVIAVLRGIGDTQGGVALMGRTRMRRALPITVADKLDAWTHPLLRHRQRLAELSPRLLVVQLGGPVGVRDARDDAVAAGVAARLGLGYAPCWHNARDTVVELGHWLALLCGSLGKVGQDVALLAQDEVGAVRLAGGGGSSAMPHKSNPVGAEVLVALARFAAAQAGALGQALVAEGERSGAAWTLEWMLLPPLAVAAAASLRHAQAMLPALTFVPETVSVSP